MTQPFIGQIQSFGFNFAPRDWALCNGQLMPISQNTALFALIGTLYGGNGQTTFALPNLQSRVPMHFGNGLSQGEEAGQESVTLNITTMPAHGHAFVGSANDANDNQPGDGASLAPIHDPKTAPRSYYGPDAVPQPLNMSAVSAVGGNLPHNNIQPYLAINWCIALTGVFPSRN